MDRHCCFECPTRKTTEWRDLDERELEIIERAKKTRNLGPGEVLFHQGDACAGVYCIQSGLIGLRRIDEQGESALLKLFPAGTTTGYKAFLSKTPHQNSAEVLSPTTVCFINRATVTVLLSDNPKLGERFLQRCIEDLNEAEDKYVHSLIWDKKTAFLHTLMVFFERYGDRDERGNPFVDLPVRRSELAELIGVRPESLSRMIRALEAEGVMHFEKTRVSIRKMDQVLDQLGAAH